MAKTHTTGGHTLVQIRKRTAGNFDWMMNVLIAQYKPIMYQAIGHCLDLSTPREPVSSEHKIVTQLTARKMTVP